MIIKKTHTPRDILVSLSPQGIISLQAAILTTKQPYIVLEGINTHNFLMPKAITMHTAQVVIWPIQPYIIGTTKANVAP